MSIKVQFKITKKDLFTNPQVEYSQETAIQFKPAYSTGQIIFVEDAGQIFVDFHNWRRCYSASSAEIAGVVKYIGVSSTNPFTDGVTIGGKKITPTENDMLTYGKKEYIYRKVGENEYEWLEIGDEDSPAWDVDNEE